MTAAPPDNKDIEILLSELRHIRSNINDPLLGSVFWEQAMKEFIEKRGRDLIALLEELEKRRVAVPEEK